MICWARASTAEIACALRIPQGTAAGVMRESRGLTHALPLTLQALRTGQISARHAQRMRDHVASIPPLPGDRDRALGQCRPVRRSRGGEALPADL
ncbi:DUF222 domain-containing protein [Cryobacterium psychrophilum]|uniref:DUF222 domain-containing protein n=1 Tax=Cryobacterium psychrophilum TaxID=41988 RepID=UPI0014170C1E